MSRNLPLQKILLTSLVAGGILTVALVAPNLIGAVRNFDPAYARRKDVRRRIQETLWRMERKNLIALQGRGSERRVTLLPSGRRLIEKIRVREYSIPKPLVWDGKWRIVMFDVPERRRRVRNQLRHLLEASGLVRLHDSVWAHPYPCDELVTLIKAHLKNVRGEVHYAVSELIGSDYGLREHFGFS